MKVSQSAHRSYNLLRKPMDANKAAETLNKNFDLLDTAAWGSKKDGKVSPDDLRAIIQNPGTPADLREAAQFLLNNPSYFNQIDASGKQDMMLSRTELNSFVSGAKKPSAHEPPRKKPNVGNSYRKRNNGKTNTAELVKILKQLLAMLAAQKNEGSQKAEPNKGNGSQDQIRNDFRPVEPFVNGDALVNNNNVIPEDFFKKKAEPKRSEPPVKQTPPSKPKRPPMNAKRSLETIRKYFSTVDTASERKYHRTGNQKNDFLSSIRFHGEMGVIDRQDLQAILTDPSAPEDLKEACGYMLDHEGLFRSADGVNAFLNAQDGKINLKDLDETIKRYYSA